MRKNKENKRFIQNCYYKLKAHRSLSIIKSNPILVPNLLCESTLCAASTKKQNPHFHEQTFTNWLDIRLSSCQIKKLNQKNNVKVKDKFEETIVARPINYINEPNKIKLQTQVRQLKQQRKRLFRSDYKLQEKLKFPNKIHPQQRISRVNHQTTNFGKNFNFQQRDKQKSIQNIRNRRYAQKTNASPGILLKKIPNKPNKQYIQQQFIRNQSNYEFTGWELDPTDNQELLGIRNSKYKKI